MLFPFPLISFHFSYHPHLAQIGAPNKDIRFDLQHSLIPECITSMADTSAMILDERGVDRDVLRRLADNDRELADFAPAPADPVWSDDYA